MKTEKLMDYIGQIDDGIIEEADIAFIKSKAVKRPWIKWVSVAAAAVCLAISVPFILNRIQPADPIDYSNLPKLAVNTEFDGQAFGFEGYMAYDISELQSGNPWTVNNNLTTLPVFTNPNQYDGAGAPVNGLSAEEMLARSEEVAKLFNLEITSLYTEPTMKQIEQIKQKLESVDASEEEIRQNTAAFRATVECNGVKINVQKDGHIVIELKPEAVNLVKEIGKLSIYDSFIISFEYGYETIGDTMYSTGLPLPDGYSFTYDNTSHEQAKTITEYLFSEYGGFMGITTPGYDLSASRNIYGQLAHLDTSVFENAGSLTERILNYNFYNLYFSATDLGGLGSIRYNKRDLSQKIGDYPIITAEEARKLLLEKHYITTVPEEFPGEKYIAGVELVYRTSRRDTVYMPYYKFLVEMPTMERENGLKNFGVFYVPAVQSEFLENMPLWDGSFN